VDLPMDKEIAGLGTLGPKMEAPTAELTGREGFDVSGFAIVPALLTSSEAEVFRTESESFLTAGAGARGLLNRPTIASLARQLLESPRLAAFLPREGVAVQCTYFEKTSDTNWFVPWHQDVSLPCRRGFGEVPIDRWSVKEGDDFVAAPAVVLETVVAVRIHLDPSREENGPLLVWPESHRSDLLSEREIGQLAGNHPVVACCAEAGDAVVMRPLLVHSSKKSRSPLPRRVLHFLFGPVRPPLGLMWNVDETPSRGV
jgi:hypothetical protein